MGIHKARAATRDCAQCALWVRFLIWATRKARARTDYPPVDKAGQARQVPIA